jgi:sec-independent protein translocase protein TatA
MLLFGGRRLPNMMEDLAKGIKSFKKGLKDDDAPVAPKEISDNKNEADKG